MQRCWLKGKAGDALHAVLCAAGYNLRWLLRAIVRFGIKPFFFVLAWLRWLAAVMPHPSSGRLGRFRSMDSSAAVRRAFVVVVQGN